MNKNKQSRIKNLEFKISFSETNLTWLAGEPDSEERTRKIAFNREAIEKAKDDLVTLKNGMTLDSIKQAWDDGETVCWSTDNYEILKDCIGQWLIWSKDNDHYVGLTEAYVKDCYIKRD